MKMNAPMSLDSFLKENHIDQETWTKADIKWENLLEIAEDHIKHTKHLSEAAEFFARIIRKFEKVHSVRWRVKETSHLLEKIVRKRAEENNKYAEINAKNYFEIVTDLIGIRALHLFKEDCFAIDDALKALWNPIETPVAYIRSGDNPQLIEQFKAHAFEIKDHSAGYRSIHYVVASDPTKRKIKVEIQVRTIFEEGWSEIDHKIRYPNFSKNEQIEYFLTIFNRLAGNADEMGSFVLELKNTLKLFEERVIKAQEEKEKSVQDMEEAINQLENANKKDIASQKSIAKLKDEVAKLRVEVHSDVASTVSHSRNALSLLASTSALDHLRAGNTLSSLSSTSALDQLKVGTVISAIASTPALDELRTMNALSSLSSTSALNQLKVGTVISSIASSPALDDLRAGNTLSSFAPTSALDQPKVGSATKSLKDKNQQ